MFDQPSHLDLAVMETIRNTKLATFLLEQHVLQEEI